MEDSLTKKVNETLFKDLGWWQKQSEEFKSQYKGKWIAVGEEQVVASCSLDSLGKLAKRLCVKISAFYYTL